MRKKRLLFSRKIMAGILATSMITTLAGTAAAVPSRVSAASTPALREDNTIVYFVDCGDYNVNTVSDGDQLGTHNSVTDQAYGEDPVTGYMWGIDDTRSDPLKNDSCNLGGISTDWTWPYEFNSGDDMPKTTSNRYTKNQYEKGIEERYLDYEFEIENGSYYVEVCCCDPWDCSRSPAVYLNKGEPNEVILTEALNISGGETAKGTINITEGNLSVNLRGNGDDNKAINLAYIIIREAGDSSMAQNDLAALTIRERVTSNLSLPTTGQAGSTITWQSDNTAVIATDGKVTRPEAGDEDAVVTLTASATFGEATKTRQFVVTVPAKSDLMGMEDLGLENVRVTDPYYTNSLDLEIQYLLKLDADRLLAGFRETAGYASGMSAAERTQYMKNKSRYTGGWENALMGGQALGHYLAAMAQAYVNEGTSDENKTALKDKLDYVVDALKDCQDKTSGTEYDGFIFGATLVSTTDLDIQFDNVEQNKTNIATQAWVPWYTLDQIFLGLIHVYKLTDNETAYDIAKKLGDWTYNRVSKWTTDIQKTVLSIEYGDMNGCLYELYALVKEKEGASAAGNYAVAAHWFDEIDLFELVNKGTKNALDGKHANTTIPKFLGALKRYLVLGDEQYLEYVETFWDYVINHHTYITGGNSEWEHFGADDVLDAERTNANCETCNTYNMLKITRQLFMITGEPKYTDYYENTYINAIMSSQNPETGMSMYFQPMASGYQKVYSTEEENFWCCTGTGMENFTKLNDSIYYQTNNRLVISMYLASTVEFAAGNMQLTQEGDLTQSETMTLSVKKIDNQADLTGELRLRLPDWLAGEACIAINGTIYDYAIKDRYAIIPGGTLSDGDTVTLTLPMKAVAYNLPDGENTYAFKYGPYVLSAKLGSANQSQGTTGVNVSVPTTKAIANDKVAIKSADTVAEYMEDIENNLLKTEGKMEFQLKGTNNSYTFVPHYQQYQESYAIYWTFSVDEDARGAEAILAEKEAARVQSTLIEGARPGYGQDELGFEETGTGSTGSSSPCWRYANADGTFQYVVKVTDSGDHYLLCAFAKEEDGKTIKIKVGDTEIFSGTLDSTAEEAININLPDSDAVNYYQMRFTIPSAVISANKTNRRMEGTEEKTAENGYTFIPVSFSSNNEEASAKLCLMLYTMRAYRTDNELTNITSSVGTVTKNGTTYQLTVPYDKIPKALFSIRDSAGYVMVDGSVIDETMEKTLTTTGIETVFPIQVVAEDFETTRKYTLKVIIDYAGFDTSLRKNLVKAYSFNDTMGDAVAVTKAFDPQPVSNPTYTYVNGKNGKAVQLSGSYGLKLQGTEASGLGESYTVSWWMKPDVVGGEYDPTFAAGTFNPQYWLNATFDAKIWSHYNGTYYATEAAELYQANEWQHVAVVIDGNTAGTETDTVVGTLYLNGTEISKGNVRKGIMTNPNASLYFGVNAWDAYFQGAVDDILLFDRTLSASEVQGITEQAVIGSTFDSEDSDQDRDEDKTEEETDSKTDDSNKGNTDDNLSIDPGSEDNKNSGNSTSNTSQTAAQSISVKAAGYTLSGNRITLKKGKKVTLKVSVSPAVTSQNVTFTSSSKKTVAVSAKGVITAKKAGTAKITIKTTNGKKKVITVNVVKKDKVNKKLKLKQSNQLSLKRGNSKQITVKKMTRGTTSRLIYKSNKKSVASINQFGLITAKKKGTTVITVKCGRVTRKIKVTVKKQT